MIYPALFLFVATAAFASWSLWWSWLEQSRVWRIGYLVAIALEIALAAWECSFAMAPVREWIRVDLLLTLPMTLLTAVSLLVRHALLLAHRRRRQQHSDASLGVRDVEVGVKLPGGPPSNPRSGH